MTRNRVLPFVVLLSLPGFFWSLGSAGLACTLYGAIGAAVEGGGVLVGKNRDLAQEEEQVLVREAPAPARPFSELPPGRAAESLPGSTTRVW